MDYLDAVEEVLEKASKTRLPGYSTDVVSAVRRQFARRWRCDYKLIIPIERALKDCLSLWTKDRKREIWESTETGFESDVDCDDIHESGIDMDLEGELMYHIHGRAGAARPGR
ncbi:MAG: hypothetical protein HY673_09920 [Chloroflexi bacterium]|nr:hypothetical protein [Chloroflexota bacterium]